MSTGAVVALLALVFVVLLNNPGWIEPLRNANGAVIEGDISEIVRMPIGGVEQGMIIQSDDRQINRSAPSATETNGDIAAKRRKGTLYIGRAAST